MMLAVNKERLKYRMCPECTNELSEYPIEDSVYILFQCSMCGYEQEELK